MCRRGYLVRSSDLGLTMTEATYREKSRRIAILASFSSPLLDLMPEFPTAELIRSQRTRKSVKIILQLILLIGSLVEGR